MAEATEQKAAATTKKATKTKKPARYPSYNVMITEAISAQAEKGGSSRQSIVKYITKHYKVSPSDRSAAAQLKLALRRGVFSGTLKQSRGSGASGSFKLGSVKKEEKKPTKGAVKPKAKKAKAPKKVIKSPKKADKKVKKAKVAPNPKSVKKPKTPKKPKKAAAKKVTKGRPKAKKSAAKK